MYPLYFIANDNIPHSFPNAVRREIQANPSNYLFHDTHTVTHHDEFYTVTGVYLKKVNLTNNKLHIQSARKKEGILSCGLGPKFTDDKAKIVFSVTRLQQLYYNPSWSEDKTPFWGMLCLKIGISLIPLEYALSSPLLNNSRTLLLDYSKVVELNYDDPHSLKLTPYYKKREETFMIPYARIVTPGASVPSFLGLNLHHYDTFLCICQANLRITNVKVILEEHSWCRVDSETTVDVQKDVRTLVLMDSLEEHIISHDQFKNNGTGFTLNLPAEVYNCKLPNIGPSFFSDPLSRTYKVRVKMRLLCETRTCYSELSTLMNVDVALESHLSSLQQIYQPKKRDMRLFIERTPMGSNVLLEVANAVALKVKNLSSRYIYHITTAVLRKDHVVGITAVYLSEKHKSTEMSSQTDFSCLDENAMIMKPNGWSLTELKNHQYVDTECFFDFPDLDNIRFPSPHQVASLDKRVKLVASSPPPVKHYPGATLDELVDLSIHVGDTMSVCLCNINIKLVKQQARVNPGGTNVVKTESWTLFSELTSSYFRKGVFHILGENFRCKIPDLEPSVFSSGLVITYWIFITVDCRVNMCSDLHMSNAFAIYTAQEDTEFLSVPPPPYKTEKKKRFFTRWITSRKS